MATGGFKYARVTLQKTSEMKASKTVFAKAVHKARCEAFLRASTLAEQTWTSVDVPVGGGIYRTYSESVNKSDSETQTVYVQDYAAQEYTNPSFLGYVSVFKKGAAEYMILTVNTFDSSGFSETAVNLGNNKKLLVGNGYLGFPATLAHAYAANGFASYDLNSNTAPASGELVPYPCFGAYCHPSRGNDYTILSRYSSDESYIFGYNIKDDVIMAFLKSDTWNGCKWGIIGKIFYDDCVGGNPYGAITNNFSNYYEYNQDTYKTKFLIPSTDSCVAQVLGFNGKPFPVYRGNTYSILPMLTPSYYACERKSSYSGELKFGALCVSIQVPANSTGSESVGENGENVKGFINTDILRVIPAQRSRSDGALLKDGEFITLENGSSEWGVIGICVGWDPSNPSLY